MKRTLNLHTAFLYLLLFFVLATGNFFPAAISTYAEEGITSVIQDLSADKTFDWESYPNKANDYSLEVITVAESTNDELFIYVYQPSDQTKDFPATSINLSTTINSDIKFKNYKLKLLSSENVFDKYVVLDFKTPDSTIRYYDISGIYRAFDSSLGDESTFGTSSTSTEVVFKVAKRFTFSDENDATSLSVSEIEVVEIINPYAGFIQYNAGFFLMQNKACRSHFIAFSTDYKIDKLMQADVEWDFYRVRQLKAILLPFLNSEQKSETVQAAATLLSDDPVSYMGDGWFAKEYNWQRIQSVDEFISSEELTDATKTALEDSGATWVLRFFESPILTNTSGGPSPIEDTFYYNVENVNVLRLNFMSDGTAYNLGAVANKVTGDSIPDNVNTNEYDPLGWIFGLFDETNALLQKILSLILSLGLLILVVVVVFKLIDWISNARMKKQVNDLSKKGKKKTPGKAKRKKRKK